MFKLSVVVLETGSCTGLNVLKTVL